MKAHLTFGVVLLAVAGGPAVRAFDVIPTEGTPVPVTFTVSQIVVAPGHGLLFLREETKALHVIDLATGSEIERYLPTEQFTDMDLTADGEFLFVADHASSEYRPDNVHRYDLATKGWKVSQAPKTAYRIKAISDDRILLGQSEITLNDFDDTMKELSRAYYG